MGNLSSSLLQGVHLALLGDSTFDNKAYTQDSPSVTEHLIQLGNTVTLCAKDGALISALLPQSQTIPETATHLIISIGGNNGLSLSGILLKPIDTVEQGVILLHDALQTFEAEYSQAINELSQQFGSTKKIILCTLYNPCFEYYNVSPNQKAVNVGVTMIADVIQKVAHRHGFPVIDFRRFMTTPECFANPIEPSGIGGEKIAKAIIEVISQHNFESRTSIVYPQHITNFVNEA
jgi:hypothetical protein